MPEVTNGPITSYSVVHMLVAMGTRMENSTNATSLVLDRLEPYANYTIVVQACTTGGCGPFSEEIIALTQEEGMCKVNAWMLSSTDTHVLSVYLSDKTPLLMFGGCWGCTSRPHKL